MTNLVVKQFQGSEVRFENREGKIWGCLTDMAKVTNKQVPEYLRLASTKDLLDISGEDSIEIKRGRYGGTWGTEDIVIDFAIWSNLEFRLWTIQSIKELLTTGIATVQRSNESLEDYQKREEILKTENQRLLTENGYLQAWSPRMSLPKMRYLEVIGYTPEEYSPFLKPTEYYSSPESDWDLRQGRLVQDLIDTLFEPGKTVCYCDHGFKSIEGLLKYLPGKFYGLCTDSPFTSNPEPQPGFERFRRSIKVCDDELFDIWLEYVPARRANLESYLSSSELVAV